MKNERKRTGIFEKTSDALDIPGEIAVGLYRMTVTAGRKVHIENHRGVLVCSDTEIKINCGKTIVGITGIGLEIRQISASEILISGEVQNISLEK